MGCVCYTTAEIERSFGLFIWFRIVVGVGWPVPSQAEQHETPESNLIVVVVVIVAVRMGGGKREEEWGREREKKHNHQSKREIKIRWKECGERKSTDVMMDFDTIVRSYNIRPSFTFYLFRQNKTLISWKDFCWGKEKNKRRKGIFWWDV